MTTAKADVIHAVFTDQAGVAETAVAADAVAADAAIRTKLVRCAVGTFFAALRTDLRAVGAAPATSHADNIHAEFTYAAIIAEVIFAAYTVTAGAAFGA